MLELKAIDFFFCFLGILAMIELGHFASLVVAEFKGV
jgi:hypothetical protein